ncbi:HEPN domain-containing protein [Dysgonomonas sp. 25]|uniref:HEPN domain-containing protein n=1 Tax=Dysgonomonas sp. 25 TaxID=2302933 RepID=UPI0013D7D9CC|nr:HEPN domain-containing protein [Dysgonomonas sp. 25]NDV68432.1 HEPN domain-containing protein [Dysgonomonas sp. 25]
MKKSIAFLPSENKKDLKFIVETVLERLKQTEMIILYGSYARNNFTVYDEKREFRKVQFYVSDYDILVVTSGISDGAAMKTLNNVIDIYFRRAKDPDRQPPLQFITEDITKLNKNLKECRYFYTQIKDEGIVLYNSGRNRLVRKRNLNYKEIKQQAQEYFEEKFHSANVFLKNALFNYQEKEYRMASFMLHQATENLFYAIRLVFTLQNAKQHNLYKLLNSVKQYSDEFVKVFPCNTSEEERLFELLKQAYVNGRYDPDFVVTKEDIDALVPKVELLRDITQRICEEKIKEYGEME